MIDKMKGAARNPRLPVRGPRRARLGGLVAALCLAVQPAWAQTGPSRGALPSARTGPAPAAPQAVTPTPAAPPVPPAAPPPPAAETAPPGVETAPPPEPVPADEADPRALTDFRPALDPHGTWVQDPNYGLVWIPHQSVVGRDFSPYVSSGHWELTNDDQWIWVSDYPFGWVTFHYGRWVWTNSGWAWIPGYRYAPAWVDWRVADYDYGYVGWAPYPASYGWFNGVAVSLWFTPYYAWVFCPSYYVFSPRVHYHVVHDRATVYRVAAHTRVYRASGRYYGVPRAPSAAIARIPARAVPRQRAEADPRSLEFARRNVREMSGARVVASPRSGAPGAGDRGVVRAGQRGPIAPERRTLPDARSAAPQAAPPRADVAPPRAAAPGAPAPQAAPQAAPSRRAAPSTSAPVLRRPKLTTPPPRMAPRSFPSRPPMHSMPRGAPSRRSR